MQDYIEGDLMEVYERRLRRSGKARANALFIVDVLLLFRPGIINPTWEYQHLTSYGMIRNYFKTAWRVSFVYCKAFLPNAVISK